MKNPILIYGCYGYTGKLIVDLASEKKASIVLAGRDASKVKSLASAHNLPYEVFDSGNSTEVDAVLSKYKVLLNCAGPFTYTAPNLMNACIKHRVHYLDITGEYQVFELGASLNEKAQHAGITILPGVGFDVVPSDCLANYLKSKLPDANSLEMALFSKGGRLSHGTAITITENLGKKTLVRRNKELKEADNGTLIKKVNIDGKNLTAVAISWGDISTAFVSTAIPNITIYNCLPKSVIKSMKISNYIGWILQLDFVKKYAIKKIKSKPAGPSDEERKNARMFIWGEVKNEKNETARAVIEMPEGYTLTAMTALAIAEKVADTDFQLNGFHTPATAFGVDFIMEFEGVIRIDS